MEVYRLVRYRGGGWQTVWDFGHDREEAKAAYLKLRREEPDALLGVTVSERSPLYMLYRSDWEYQPES